MTVNYAQEVATERIGGFFRMLFRWRGSIYRAVAGEMTVFLVLYYVLNMSYYFIMPSNDQKRFARFCKSCEGFADYIPVTFIVGFFTVRVIARRWTQWENIPWPDKCVFNISGNLHGLDVKARLLRRTLARYVNLGSILCYRDISVAVKRRFPSFEHLVVGGMMTIEEQKLYEDTICADDTNFWVPFHWAFMLVEKAMQEGRLDSGQMNKIRDDILDLRQKCWVLFSHDWIPIPMVYTQVVTLAVYLFMLACLFGRQNLVLPTDDKTALSNLLNLFDMSNHDKWESMKNHTEYFFPFFTLAQLVFYLGWLKVAEILINPWGLDPDDFEINYIIDRNLRVSYTVVDYGYNRLPPLEKDIHWDADEPELPYTQASAKAGVAPFVGSAANVNVPQKQAELAESSVPAKECPKNNPSRQASLNGPTASNPAATKPDKSMPALLRPFSRLISKENEILDGVAKSPPTAKSSKMLKHHKEKLDTEAAVAQELQAQGLEMQKLGLDEMQKQHSRLEKIDENKEASVHLLEGEKGKGSDEEDEESIFYLSETPPATVVRPVVSPGATGEDTPDASRRAEHRKRPPLPHQQRPIQSQTSDSPPVFSKEHQPVP